MGLLLRNSRELVEVSSSMTLLDWFRGGKTASGVNVTASKAMGLPAVWRAVSLISGACAALPLHAYRQQGSERVPADGRSEAAVLLGNPHPDMTSFELWELVYVHVLLWGNAYLRILRDDSDKIRELWPLHPSEVQAGRASNKLKVYQVEGDRSRDGKPFPHTDETILHIPGMGYDGITGVSPIRAARQGFGLALAAEEYGARLFGSGSLASGILQTEQRLTQSQADALKERWEAKAQGIDRAHEAVVLDRGATFKQLTIPPQDAQFIESRRFQISEVARMFGVPPHMLMDTEKSTSWGTGIEQQDIGFVKWSLRPWLTRFEQRVTKLFSDDTLYARYSVEGLLRGDSKSRAEFYKAMWDLGVLSTNEIRAYEELAPVEGGDARYRPLNMGKLGEFDGSDDTQDPTADPDQSSPTRRPVPAASAPASEGAPA